MEWERQMEKYGSESITSLIHAEGSNEQRLA
jgi:hypothetical protein